MSAEASEVSAGQGEVPTCLAEIPTKRKDEKKKNTGGGKDKTSDGA